MKSRDLREQNRLSWNAVAGAHESHRGDLAGFLRSGGSTLFPEELELLGPLEGKTLAHLQCNAGGDSLSLALRGAEVTGVDFSDEAILRARALSEEAGIPAVLGTGIATNRIRSGQAIQVDGDRGTVTLLDETDAEQPPPEPRRLPSAKTLALLALAAGVVIVALWRRRGRQSGG